MRIACIDNVSAAAYRLIAPEFARSVVFLPPSRTTEALEDGRCDFALVPSAELRRLSFMARPITGFGIAAFGPVGSVLYLGELEPEEASMRGERVYVAPESRTARMLFPILCQISFGTSPQLVDDLSQVCGRIVIGNEALGAKSSAPVSVDLSAWWRRQTRMPMVFAQWMIRRGMPKSLETEALAWLGSSVRLSESRGGRTEMAREVIGLGFSTMFAQQYYRGIQYRLSERHHIAIKAFQHLAEQERCAANA